MSYYFLHEERKIPTLLAYILIAVFTIGLASVLHSLSITPISRAAPLVVPKQLIISNVTNSSASIVVEFPQKASLAVRYHPVKDTIKQRLAFDERDTSEQQARRIHLVRLLNLTPGTTYEFQLLINSKLFSGQQYTVTTFSDSDVYGNQPPLFGKIVQSNLKPLPGILVQLRFPDINKTANFTALSNASGSWIISVPIIKSDVGEHVQLDDTTKAEIRFTDGNKQTMVFARISQTAPLRTVVLGQQYNLDTQESVLGEYTDQSKSYQKNLQILFPLEGGAISSRFIRARGIAKPGSSIALLLSPTEQQTTTSADDTGAWVYQNSIPLKAGGYSLTATSTTENASTHVSFTVTKEGERVLGEATGSATITPEVTPDVTTLISPTDVPPPPPITSVAPTASIPSTGFSTNMLIITASSLSLLGLVLLLY